MLLMFPHFLFYTSWCGTCNGIGIDRVDVDANVANISATEC